MRDAVQSKVEFIEPEDYPQMLSKPEALRALRTLQSPQTQVKAQEALAQHAPVMRDAVLQLVELLEEMDSGDMKRIFAAVHEIRGVAETGGLVTTGRIAEILCRYMDDMERLQKPLDGTLVGLHVAAIARAARSEQEDAETGETVAIELAALVARRIADAGGR
jgi:chemotaxis protein histidine kinase CheA